MPFPARIVTFYSYKGGVGRSFALANVAVTLARWRYRVLCIDWDIEAPGLSHYFGSIGKVKGGLIDLLENFKKKLPDNWHNYLYTFSPPDATPIAFLPAGTQDDTYATRVQEIDWDELYRDGFGERLEQIRAEITLSNEYDFILIDGRTGITDFNGIVTAQLPDILIFLFTSNEQSVEGSIEVVRKANKARNALPVNRGRLLSVPVPARFDDRVEKNISDRWRATFLERMAEFYAAWAVDGVDRLALQNLTTIPYVPYWSFGEKLSVLEERPFSTTSINYAIETLAALIARQLTKSDLLVENRDAYVAGARRFGESATWGRPDVILLYSQADSDIAERLVRKLKSRGMLSVTEKAYSTGETVYVDTYDLLDRARNLVVLIGEQWSTLQEADIARFVRYSAEDITSDRDVFPILIPGATIADKPSFLRRLHYLSLASLSLDEIADNLVDQLSTGKAIDRMFELRETARYTASPLRRAPNRYALASASKSPTLRFLTVLSLIVAVAVLVVAALLYMSRVHQSLLPSPVSSTSALSHTKSATAAPRPHKALLLRPSRQNISKFPRP